jgi:hypothetical protein
MDTGLYQIKWRMSRTAPTQFVYAVLSKLESMALDASLQTVRE